MGWLESRRAQQPPYPQQPQYVQPGYPAYPPQALPPAPGYPAYQPVPMPQAAAPTILGYDVYGRPIFAQPQQPSGFDAQGRPVGMVPQHTASTMTIRNEAGQFVQVQANDAAFASSTAVGRCPRCGKNTYASVRGQDENGRPIGQNIAPRCTSCNYVDHPVLSAGGAHHRMNLAGQTVRVEGSVRHAMSGAPGHLTTYEYGPGNANPTGFDLRKPRESISGHFR